MKAVIQRVKRCSVKIGGRMESEIGPGILIFLGVHEEDSGNDAANLAEKCSTLRIFEDIGGKMTLSVRNVEGSAMVVSQFTLYGETKKGNRPNFMHAAKPDLAEKLYSHFIACLEKTMGKEKVATGIFRAMMDVELVNDGPVTIIMETGDHD